MKAIRSLLLLVSGPVLISLFAPHASGEDNAGTPGYYRFPALSGDTPDRIESATLGAEWVRDESRNGWRIAHIYRSDPDYPDKTPPLAMPRVEVQEGHGVESINGVPTLSVAHPQLLLRNQAERHYAQRKSFNG